MTNINIRIIITSINIFKFIKIEENYMVIEPINKNTVYLNGKLITKRSVLASYDRIIIGEGNCFIFKYPNDKIDLIKNHKFINFLEERYSIKGKSYEI